MHQKTSSENKFTTYQARITGPELSNSVLCGLYLKIAEKNYHKVYFLVNNSCNFEVISNSNILKQIYKKENNSSKNPNLAHTLFIKLFPLKAYKNATSMDYNSR
jgi:hypothetical protein